jgi:hypothetical protein
MKICSSKNCSYLKHRPNAKERTIFFHYNKSSAKEFFGRNSFKNGQTRVVEFPPPILVEYRSSWPKFFQTGRILPKMGQKKTNHGSNFGRTWTIFDLNRWQKFNCARTTVLKRISAKKNTVCLIEVEGSF